MDPAEQEAIHDRAAAARFPGPDYYEVLCWLHEELRPAGYVEIGVLYGESLKLAMPPTVALGIDPLPKADHPWRTTTRIVPLSSAEFFARHDLRDFLGMDHFGLAFIDGLHLYEEALKDLHRLERYAASDSLVAVHDTIPLDAQTSSRERRTNFHTGDVWKLIPFLSRWRPDLEMVTVRTAPSGLTLIRGFAGQRHAPREHYFIPNEHAVVRSWLLRQ